jgi:hypothetical protein
MKWGGFEIEKDDIEGKVLDIVVPRNSGTPSQRGVIAASTEHAGRLGILIFVSPY